MSEKEAVHGLNCPNCGGVVPIPEGQIIVHCPYCDLRSYVRGERGLRRYQVPQVTSHDDALQALRRFFKSNWAIARDAAHQSQLSEAFLVYLPFWAVWGRVAAWAFGQKKEGSGEHEHYEPREVRIVQEMTWNGAACDVGEFGVDHVPPLSDQTLDPFEPQKLHNSGMVFEPVGSYSQAQASAEDQFQSQVRQKARLDRLAQLFVRFFRRRYGLVYYPLWVLRYLYRGRAFQVVVDGSSGKVLYGRAPGNTLYRAGVLVGGMALGAFLAVDATSFIISQSSGKDSGPGWLVLVLFLGGLGLMVAAYRAFRYGEQYEYHSSGTKTIGGLENPLEMVTKISDVEQWIDRIN
jgi:hypothetical protein